MSKRTIRLQDEGGCWRRRDVTTSGGDPGGPGVKGPPTFLSGVTYKAVTPSFDAVLMSLFFALYIGYGRRRLSLIKFCFDLDYKFLLN